jgi:hypothetical protein
MHISFLSGRHHHLHSPAFCPAPHYIAYFTGDTKEAQRQTLSKALGCCGFSAVFITMGPCGNRWAPCLPAIKHW